MNHQQEIDQLVSDSGYLTEAARRAATTTEAEARAASAQSAFLTVVKTASEMTTEGLLQHAKNHAHRLWCEENLTEEEFNAAMLEFCWCLADGDELKAKLLASAVI